MQDFEKLGAFYLGRTYDAARAACTDDLLLYDARDLTTHAVCVGMTGSGKTGLCVTLLEEAAIDGIPAIVIDPKGDLGNLLLTFPGLRPEDFRAWVDPAEAARKGQTPDEFAAATAAAWRQGLADWGQDADRIARLRAAAELAIYTPGSTAGRPLSILGSFAAPPPELAADSAALRDRILSAVSGLLGLLGMTADPIQSREHILLSTLLDRAWREGRNLDLATLIRSVQKPPFDKVGVFDLESFYPARERFGLAMMLNNLLASPGFSAWMEGEALDIQRLLYTADGRPRVAVISIAHLSDSERMFFVTILLNELVAWMRGQPGTSSLRAILYMDEIFGYFPPTANPPSKTPMLTLLKQARAFGLGVVLSTQNPVDLDYKGLGNTGTWFIGRLQTERDRARVIDGLESATAGGPAFDRAELETLLAGLGNRVFLMRNMHDDQPVLFQSRWALSYLRGPMTLAQIQKLTAPPPAAATATAATATFAPPPPAPAAGAAAHPALPAGVPEFYLRPSAGAPTAAAPVYQPHAAGVARLHFVDARADVDAWVTQTLVAPFTADGGDVNWFAARVFTSNEPPLDRQSATGAAYAPTPAGALNAANYKLWTRTLESHLYQNATLELCLCPELKLTAKAGESEGDFRARLALAVRESRDLAVQKLRARYAPKLAAMQERLRRAEERVQREQSQAAQQKMQTAISLGATILGALLGRRVASAGNVGRATTTLRGAGRISREQQDVARAQESVGAVQQQLAELQSQFDAEVAQLQLTAEPGVTRTAIRPRKSDVTLTAVGLCWVA